MIPPQGNQTNLIGSNRPPVPTAELSNLDLHDSRGEEILRMISIDGPRSDFLEADSVDTGRFPDSTTTSPYNGTHAAAAMSRPPDVVPWTGKATSPSNAGNLIVHEL